METYCDLFLQGPLSKSDAIAQIAAITGGAIERNYVDFGSGSIGVKENKDRTESVSDKNEFLNYEYRLEIEFEPSVQIPEALEWIKTLLTELRRSNFKAVPVCSYISER